MQRFNDVSGAVPVSNDEVRRILERLTRDESSPMGQTTLDVAQALGVPENRVLETLAAVRAESAAKQVNAAALAKAKHRERMILWLGALAALLLVACALKFGHVFDRVIESAGSNSTPVEVVAPRAVTASAAKPGNALFAKFEVVLEGTPLVEGVASGDLSSFPDQAAEALVGHVAKGATPRQDFSASDETTLKRIEQGRFDNPGIAFLSAAMYGKEANGSTLRLSSGSIPVYLGNDGRIERLIHEEQVRRARKLAQDAIDVALR